VVWAGINTVRGQGKKGWKTGKDHEEGCNARKVIALTVVLAAAVDKDFPNAHDNALKCQAVTQIRQSNVV